MIFYNGFNLLVDIVIGFLVFKLAYSSGYNKGFNDSEDLNGPPF
jgi:hypothetical protein